MTYNPIANWDGNRQFSINDIRMNDAMIKRPELVMKAAIVDAIGAGFGRERGAAFGAAAIGNCSRCGEWKRKRRIIAFAPSQSFGAPPGAAWVFYFTLCPSCTGSMTNAEQREWARSVASAAKDQASPETGGPAN